MKYVVQADIEATVKPEDNPEQIQDWIGKWQAHDPIGFYFSLTRRSVTIIVDVPNEDAIFEALYATWNLCGSYPTVSPVVGVEEFGSIMERLGLG